MKLQTKIKLWWARLWVRKNEMHSSLDMDLSIMCDLNKEELQEYITDITHRRSIAHERDLERDDR